MDERGVSLLVQVCMDPREPSINERELRALLKGARELKCKNLTVITMSYKGEEKIEGYLVKYIPLYDWFIQHLK